MNKQISHFLTAAILIAVFAFSGIGLYRTVNDNYTLPETTADYSRQTAICSNLLPSAFITGPLTAAIGELCIFKLNDAAVKADWVIIPSATAYIDSSGSSFAFASNVPARYTVIAAIVENGQPKILTHVCEYGISPEPSPIPKPNPTPPVTLKDWVSQNTPPDGKEQAAALADCYESVADSIHKESVKSIEAAYALIRNVTQTKTDINI
jgi:hypothetical protein